MTGVFAGNGLAFGAWAGNIPRLREAAGLGEASLGIVLLCVSIGAVLAMPVAGRYAARLGTARACWMAGLLLAAGLPLTVLAPGWWTLLAAALLLGAGLGMMDVCMNAHAAELERGWGAPIMSSFHAGWSLGQLVGAATAGLLAAAGTGLLVSLTLPALFVAGFGLAALRLPDAPQAVVEPVRFAWPSRGLLVLCAVIALSFAVEGGTADWSGVYLRTVLDAQAGLATSALTVFAGAMVVFRLCGDWIVRRLGPGRTIGFGGGLVALGLAAAVLAPGVGVATAGFALVGIGVANIVPVVFSVAGRKGAAGVAMVATAGYGTVMASPPLIGFVSAGFGLRTGLTLLVVGAATMALLGRRIEA